MGSTKNCEPNQLYITKFLLGSEKFKSSHYTVSLFAVNMVFINTEIYKHFL